MPETGFSRLLCLLGNSGKKATGYETVGFVGCRRGMFRNSGYRFPAKDILQIIKRQAPAPIDWKSEFARGRFFAHRPRRKRGRA